MAHTRAVKALGEIALRVNDLGLMRRFYEEVVGLELMREFEHAVFFRIAQGYGGHTQVLALFDRRADGMTKGVSEVRSTLDHLAFEIDLAAYDDEKARLDALGVTVEPRTFTWIGWRSLFFDDPEGNHVEFVCFDETVLA